MRKIVQTVYIVLKRSDINETQVYAYSAKIYANVFFQIYIYIFS